MVQDDVTAICVQNYQLTPLGHFRL